MSRLQSMAAHVARRVDKLKVEEPVETLRLRPLYARPPREFGAAFAAPDRIIEVRFAHPDAGLLVPLESATPGEAARMSAEAAGHGAAAVAVWVERHFHAGDYSHMEAARGACPNLLLLARDIIVDPWQLERVRAAGADAVELVPDLLGTSLEATALLARDLGLTPAFQDPDGRWRPVL